MVYRPPQKQRLKPPKRVRRVMPRVCGSCRFFQIHRDEDAISHDAGYWECRRDPEFKVLKGVDVDAGDMLQWFYTCDRWAAAQ